MKKRFLSFLTAVAIGCTSVAMPAFAEAGADVSNIYTFEVYDFGCHHVLPEGWSETNGFSNRPDQDVDGWTKDNAPYLGTELYARKGVFGKPSGDTAYDVTTLFRETKNGNFKSVEYDTRYNMAANLEGRRYIKASSEVAIDSFGNKIYKYHVYRAAQALQPSTIWLRWYQGSYGRQLYA